MKRAMTINALSAGLALAVFAMSSLPVAAAPRPFPWWFFGGSTGVAAAAICVGTCFDGDHPRRIP